MSDDETTPEMLARLGTDATLWAQEFNETAVKLGYSKMDEGWLIGWFANAIENCAAIRCNRLRADLAAVTEERDRMRQSINSTIFRLELALNMIERPTYNPLDVGFRHSPLSQKEVIQRLTETCSFVRADLSKTMDEARAALEGVTEKSEEGNNK